MMIFRNVFVYCLISLRQISSIHSWNKLYDIMHWNIRYNKSEWITLIGYFEDSTSDTYRYGFRRWLLHSKFVYGSWFSAKVSLLDPLVSIVTLNYPLVANIKNLKWHCDLYKSNLYNSSGEDDADSGPVYKDTLDRLKESKKRSDSLEAKIANELAITLTPSVSTESIVLLSTAPQTPTPSCHSAPSSGRSTPSVTWSDHVEVFEIPKRECLENNEEEDEE